MSEYKKMIKVSKYFFLILSFFFSGFVFSDTCKENFEKPNRPPVPVLKTLTVTASLPDRTLKPPQAPTYYSTQTKSLTVSMSDKKLLSISQWEWGSYVGDLIRKLENSGKKEQNDSRDHLIHAYQQIRNENLRQKISDAVLASLMSQIENIAKKRSRAWKGRGYSEEDFMQDAALIVLDKMNAYKGQLPFVVIAIRYLQHDLNDSAARIISPVKASHAQAFKAISEKVSFIPGDRDLKNERGDETGETFKDKIEDKDSLSPEDLAFMIQVPGFINSLMANAPLTKRHKEYLELKRKYPDRELHSIAEKMGISRQAVEQIKQKILKIIVEELQSTDQGRWFLEEMNLGKSENYQKIMKDIQNGQILPLDLRAQRAVKKRFFRDLFAGKSFEDMSTEWNMKIKDLKKLKTEIALSVIKDFKNPEGVLVVKVLFGVEEFASGTYKLPEKLQRMFWYMIKYPLNYRELLFNFEGISNHFFYKERDEVFDKLLKVLIETKEGQDYLKRRLFYD